MQYTMIFKGAVFLFFFVQLAANPSWAGQNSSPASLEAAKVVRKISPVVAIVDSLGRPIPGFNAGKGYSFGSVLGNFPGHALALDPAGETILVIGAPVDGKNKSLGAFRLKKFNGRLDTKFSGKGWRKYRPAFTFPHKFHNESFVKVASDNKIYLSASISRGDISNLEFHSMVMRLRSNGSVDHTFGVEGAFRLRSPSRAVKVARGLPGKILTPIRPFNSPTTGAKIKYVIVDETTGISDEKTIEVKGRNLVPVAAVRGDQDSIYIAAKTTINELPSMAVARINAKSGDLDLSFGTDGLVFVPFHATYVRTEDIVVRNNHIYLFGTVYSPGGGQRAAIAKLTTQGKLVNSFSGNGRRVLDFSMGADSSFFAFTVDSADRPVFAGGWKDKLMLARLKSNGDVDPQFSYDNNSSFSGVVFLDKFSATGGPNVTGKFEGRAVETDDSNNVIVVGNLTQ